MTPTLTDTRRITEHDPAFLTLHAATVAQLRQSIDTYAQELQHATALPSPNAFITRHTAILTGAYVTGHTEGARPFLDYPGVSQEHPDTDRMHHTLSFYVPSVAKMAAEGLQAWQQEQRAKQFADPVPPLDDEDVYAPFILDWAQGEALGARLILQGNILWPAMQNGYLEAGAGLRTKLYWDLDPMARVHCADCPAIAAASPYDPPGSGGNELNQTPGDGHTECGAGCRCALRYAGQPSQFREVTETWIFYNPYHEPAGSPIGGRFARKGTGGGGEGKVHVARGEGRTIRQGGKRVANPGYKGGSGTAHTSKTWYETRRAKIKELQEDIKSAHDPYVRSDFKAQISGVEADIRQRQRADGVFHPQYATKMSDEEFKSAIRDAYTQHSNVSGYAEIKTVQSAFAKQYGMKSSEFSQRLAALHDQWLGPHGGWSKGGGLYLDDDEEARLAKTFYSNGRPYSLMMWVDRPGQAMSEGLIFYSPDQLRVKGRFAFEGGRRRDQGGHTRRMEAEHDVSHMPHGGGVGSHETNAWLNVHRSAHHWEISAVHPALVPEVVHTLDRMTRLYPRAAADIQHITTQGEWDKYPRAVAYTEDHGAGNVSLHLNPAIWHDPATFHAEIQHSLDTGHFAQTDLGHAEYVITHEFGHVVDFHLIHDHEAFLPVVSSRGLGQTAMTWARVMTLTMPLMLRSISRYGDSDAHEQWAETFAMMHSGRSPGGLVGGAMGRLHTLLGLVFGPHYHPRGIGELSDAEKADAEAYLRGIAKDIGLTYP